MSFSNVPLSSIKLPETIQTIEKSGFDYCSLNLEELTFPSSIVSLGVWAFSSNRIKKVIIGENIESIGDGAFGDNPTLESIEVPENNHFFKSINGCLFDYNVEILYCSPPLIQNFTFPMTTKRLTARSLSHATAIELWLPPSITIFDSGCFFRLPSLKTIHILGSIDQINTPFYSGLHVEQIYYYGHNVVKTNNVFSSLQNVTVTVCANYPSQYFSSVKVKKYYYCHFSISTLPIKRNPFSHFSLFTYIFIFF